MLLEAPDPVPEMASEEITQEPEATDDSTAA